MNAAASSATASQSASICTSIAPVLPAMQSVRPPAVDLGQGSQARSPTDVGGFPGADHDLVERTGRENRSR
jgi:hypothetical protein